MHTLLSTSSPLQVGELARLQTDGTLLHEPRGSQQSSSSDNGSSLLGGQNTGLGVQME